MSQFWVMHRVKGTSEWTTDTWRASLAEAERAMQEYIAADHGVYCTFIYEYAVFELKVHVPAVE